MKLVTPPMPRHGRPEADDTLSFIRELIGNSMHAKRVFSLANATHGVVASASLAVSMIGRGLAVSRGLVDKHAIKQVDRLLSNDKLALEDVLRPWVTHAVGNSVHVFINLDWTEFDADDHSMLVASMQTQHGRALPLTWKTVVKSELKGQRNEHEHELLRQLDTLMPDGVAGTIVADRGFGRSSLFDMILSETRFECILRFKSNVTVTDAKSAPTQKPAGEWVGKNGRMRTLHGARLTLEMYEVPVVVVVQDKDMKDIWCLMCSDETLTGGQIKQAYGKRFTCEETFRDTKDLRFGMGMTWSRAQRTDRRDRLMLLAVLAQGLLTLLGMAGEHAGLDRLLKSNTSKKRTMSLLRQGQRWYELMPNMPEKRLATLMESYAQVLGNHELWQPFHLAA